MSYKNRKASLRRAKIQIRENFENERNEALKALDDLREKLGPDFKEHPTFQDALEDYREMLRNHQDLANSFKSQTTLSWTSEEDFRRKKYSKPRKQINWGAAEDMISSRETIKKNNRLWLTEGCLVSHKDFPENTMMVLEIQDDRTQVLHDGIQKSFRTLSLRPVF